MKTAENSSNNQGMHIQWMTFRLANEFYAIEVLKIREVQRHSEISDIPGAPVYVLGLINLRGTIVTVINTRSKFGLPDTNITAETRIAILEIQGQLIGILVDGVNEVISIDENEIEPSPNVGNDDGNQYIVGVHNRHEQLIILLNPENIIGEGEWHLVSECGQMLNA